LAAFLALAGDLSTAIQVSKSCCWSAPDLLRGEGLRRAQSSACSQQNKGIIRGTSDPPFVKLPHSHSHAEQVLASTTIHR
jgi:hypothetical protein